MGGHFQPCKPGALATLDAVNPCPCSRPARLLPRVACTLALAAWAVLAAAGASGTEPAADATLAEQVRGLVGPAVRLPTGKARVELEVGQLDPRLRLAPCRRIETHLPAQSPLWGRTRIGVRCVEGERPWHVYLPVVVKVFAPALVPVRALPAGTVLAPEHLQLTEVDWAADANPAFASAEGLLGRTLGRAVAAGQAVRSGDLRQRQWFAAGDTVQLLARGEGFVVGGEAQALGNGIEGQSVRVRTESGRVLSGTPVAERRVEVAL